MTLEAAVDALHRHLASLGPDVAAAEAGGTRRYLRGGRVFAVVRALKTRVDVGFTRIGKARGKRILDARTARLPGGVRHRVVIEHVADVDAEVRAWLTESYENVELFQ